MVNSSAVQLLGLFYDLSDNTSSSAWSTQARAMFQSAVILSQRYNITIQGQPITWQSVQTEGDSLTALATTCQRITNSTIVGIVGPPYSRESAVLAPFSERIGIPLVSYAATDPTLSDSSTYPTFYRTVPADTTAALAIAQLFLQFNWRSVIVIYQNDAYGIGGATAIADVFNHLNLTVAQSIIFDIASLSIRGDLRSLLMNSLTRIVVLWMESSHARLVLEDAIRFDVLAPHFTWIFSANVPLDNFNTTDARRKLAGMLTVEPAVGSAVGGLINSTLLNEAYDIWNRYEADSFPGVDNVNSYALFAFDATWTLIQGLTQLCSLNISNTSCSSFSGDSFCFDRRLVSSDLFINILNRNAFRGVTGPIQFHKNTTNRIDGNYYIARNIHGYSTGLEYVPGLIWSNSGGWTRNAHTNVIIWPGTSLVVPSGYIEISRLTLQVAVIEAPPFIIRREFRNESGGSYTKLTGYVSEFIEQLQDNLGFTVSISYFPSDQSYNELIDAVANGTFDLLIGDVTVTSSRREKVDFSSSIFDNSLRVIIRETPDSELDLWSFLKPFSITLWIVSFAAIVYVGLLFAIIEREFNEMLQNRSVLSLIVMSLWFSFGTITGYGVDFYATTAAGRVLTVGLYVLSLVLVATYTAHLTSDLTVKKAAESISGIDDIKNRKVESNRIGILVNTSIEDYYLREISAGNRNFYPLKSLNEMFDALVNNLIDVSIMDAGILEYATSSTYCNLTLVGKDFDRSAFGIVFQKNWLFNQNLDVAVLTMKESGVLDNLKIKWFQSSACSYTEETSVAMSIESMAGLFMTFAMITTIGILWFICKKRSAIKQHLLTWFRGEKPQPERNHTAEATPNETLADARITSYL
ncbi:unnamed protein product [Adineta ricciae]|uniref:Glutamate receptor n=1 Tax=Adineta ricciae TaxID=249248 RepID=A0A814FEI4_ADIRI|nr:unnamed protein product [Adineta ricciae]CAF1571047.1 unnamed protein product [Adineta ricciae]